MHHAALFIARFCSSAWIGGATLFVIVGVREVTRGGFDAVTKDVLVTLRFPVFYLAGAILIGSAFLATLLLGGSNILTAGRKRIATLSLLAVLMVMAADYVFIYKPLVAMVTPPGSEKTKQFKQYHDASKYVNLFGLSLTLLAASLLNWPGNQDVARNHIEDRK